MALRAPRLLAVNVPVSAGSGHARIAQIRSFSTPARDGKIGRGSAGFLKDLKLGARRPFASLASFAPQLPMDIALAGKLLAKYKFLSLTAGGAVLVGIVDSLRGETKDFYDYRFITDKDPDDVGSEYHKHPDFSALLHDLPFLPPHLMTHTNFKLTFCFCWRMARNNNAMSVSGQSL